MPTDASTRRCETGVGKPGPRGQNGGVSGPEGFEWQRRSNGDVVVFHHGRHATTLRGRRAQEFIDDVESGDDQELMARVTGNYKRGNERHARQHPRHRGRR